MGRGTSSPSATAGCDTTRSAAGLRPIEKTILVSGVAEAQAAFNLTLADEQLPAALEVTLEPQPAEKKTLIRMRLLPHAPLGPFEHFVRFTTGVPRQPVLHVLATALVNDRITGPGAVQLGVRSCKRLFEVGAGWTEADTAEQIERH